MIWELMKRDQAWRVMPFIGLVLTLPALRGAIPFLVTIPFILAIGVPGFRQRCTLFQATLPISGKQLFLVRVGSLMACAWLPILAAVVVSAVLRRGLTWVDRLPSFEAGAVITVALLLVQCVRVQAIQPPVWLIVLAYAGMFSPLFMLNEVFFRRPAAVGTAVIGGCALLSAILFLKGWATVPKSFQLAPAEPISAESGKAGRAWPAATWWPVLRSLYGWQASLSLSVTLVMMLVGSFPMVLGVVVPSFFVNCRPGLRWLLHLPISTRKLFWAMWFPITTAMIAGTVFSFPEARQLLPKTRMIAFAVILISWMIQICALQLHGWKRLRGQSLTLRVILSGAPSFVAYATFMIPFFLRLAGRRPVGLNPAPDALVRSLAGILPDNLWLIGLAAALPIGGLWFLAEKLFREMEFGQIEVHAYRTLGSQL